jgi:hypothetical protein
LVLDHGSELVTCSVGTCSTFGDNGDCENVRPHSGFTFERLVRTVSPARPSFADE